MPRHVSLAVGASAASSTCAGAIAIPVECSASVPGSLDDMTYRLWTGTSSRSTPPILLAKAYASSGALYG